MNRTLRVLGMGTFALVVCLGFMAPTASAEGVLAGYKKGFFLSSSDGNFRLNIGGRVQARYTYEAVAGFGDADGQGTGTDDESAFSIPRARIHLKGHAFSPRFKYKFQADMGKGGASLKDFYVDYSFIKKKLHLQVGQWKRPQMRQTINSSGRLIFVDRAFTEKKFTGGNAPRDIGILFHNDYSKSPTFEWAFGLFNGTGIEPTVTGAVDLGTGDLTTLKSSNVPTRFQPMLLARVAYNHGGIKGYSEGDLEGGGFRFSIGAGAALTFDHDHAGEGALLANVDWVLKIKGFSTSGAFYMKMSEENDGGLGSLKMTGMGVFAQMGYVIASRYQPVARYELYSPEGGDNEHVVAAGFSTYFFKHKVKWQTDAAALLYDNGQDADYRIRTQLQFAF